MLSLANLKMNTHFYAINYNVVRPKFTVSIQNEIFNIKIKSVLLLIYLGKIAFNSSIGLLLLSAII